MGAKVATCMAPAWHSKGAKEGKGHGEEGSLVLERIVWMVHDEVCCRSVDARGERVQSQQGCNRSDAKMEGHSVAGIRSLPLATGGSACACSNRGVSRQSGCARARPHRGQSTAGTRRGGPRARPRGAPCHSNCFSHSDLRGDPGATPSLPRAHHPLPHAPRSSRRSPWRWPALQRATSQTVSAVRGLRGQ